MTAFIPGTEKLFTINNGVITANMEEDNPLFVELDRNVEGSGTKFDVSYPISFDVSTSMVGQAEALNTFLRLFQRRVSDREVAGFIQRMLFTLYAFSTVGDSATRQFTPTVRGNVLPELRLPEFVPADYFDYVSNMPYPSSAQVLAQGNIPISGGTPMGQHLLNLCVRQAAEAAFFGGFGKAMRRSGTTLADGMNTDGIEPEQVKEARDYFAGLHLDSKGRKSLFFKSDEDHEYAIYCGESFGFDAFRDWFLRAGYADANIINLGAIDPDALVTQLLKSAKSASELIAVTGGSSRPAAPAIVDAEIIEPDDRGRRAIGGSSSGTIEPWQPRR
jgi:hypothetical protein